MSNQTSNNNKRIAKNTLLLYFRMLLTMVVSLYTSRVILGALGVEDYGIYNVVSGVVAMFSMLSGLLLQINPIAACGYCQQFLVLTYQNLLFDICRHQSEYVIYENGQN